MYIAEPATLMPRLWAYNHRNATNKHLIQINPWLYAYLHIFKCRLMFRFLLSRCWLVHNWVRGVELVITSIEGMVVNGCLQTVVYPNRSNPSADSDSIYAIDIRWPSGSSMVVCLPKVSSLGSLQNFTPCIFNLLTVASRSLSIKPINTPIPVPILAFLLARCKAMTVPTLKNSVHSSDWLLIGRWSTSRQIFPCLKQEVLQFLLFWMAHPHSF